MKILLLHPHDVFDPLEPWTIRIVNIAKELVRRKHDVRLIHFVHETSIEKRTLHPDGFQIVSLKRRGGLRLFTTNFKEIFNEVTWADIVHVQKCFHYVSLPALYSAFVQKKPIHYDWDDYEEAIYLVSAHPPRKMVHFFVRTFERILPRLVDTVSTASEELKKMCLALGISPTKLFDAPVGADLAHFGAQVSGEKVRKHFGEKELFVLYLGQLNGAQYTHLFIETVSILKKQGVKGCYIIVGSGNSFKNLKALAVDLGVDDVIHFVGAIRHDLVPAYLSAADITVACFEDNEITRCKSPLKIVEYLAAGKAIVASAVGEVRTMLKDCGVLVKPGSASALAEGIKVLAKNPAMRSELGKRARKRAEEKYNWPAVVDNLLKAYEVARDGYVRTS
jgi:glycosyltransferase involved in cell wall biosynthesis